MLRLERILSRCTRHVHAPLPSTRGTYGPRFRALTWVLLGTLVQALIAPAVTSVRGETSAAYANWLLDRGATGTDIALERALEETRGARHGSLEAFLYDFVRTLDDRGELGVALALFGSGDEEPHDAAGLLRLLLTDLRSLAPQPPKATTRVAPADPGALIVPVRAIPGTPSAAGSVSTTPGIAHSAVYHPGHHTPALGTSIQALGP